ncbi:MAG: oxidoreductase, coenzyme F420-dependent [Labilithrix sp.]|nr:oxidoreductase, coenzyme F420-dependent [Labilithrix sp.]
MRIGIIGAGNVGMTLGSSFVRAGHDVVYGSRDEGRTAPHAGALLGSIRGAVLDAEAVVLATPYAAIESALDAAGDFEGKVLIDATNPVGPDFRLVVGRTTSGAERVAALAKNAKVVKAFNTTGYDVMANPKFGAHRALMLVCGDDTGATATVAKLATDIGFDAIPLSGLARARDLEPMALLWIQLALKRGLGRNIAFGLSRRDAAGASADATVNLAALDLGSVGAAKKSVTMVGTGNIGGGLARAWLRAGHDVRLAVRDPLAPDVVDLVELGAKTIPVDGAANGSDVIVVAIPAAAVADVIPRLGELEGKIVVDCTNGIGAGMVMTAPEGTSSPELMAGVAKGARVVRAFNQQGAETLREASFDDLRAVSFVAGDDDDARQTVIGLSKDVGLDSIDAGPLEASRALDHLTLVWLTMSKALGSREIGLTLLRR